MFTTPMLLDLARKVAQIPSDYRLARVLKIGDSTLYNYRHGGRTPKDEHALQLAHLADLDPGFVLLAMACERAQDTADGPALVQSLRHFAASLGYSDLLILPGLFDDLDGPGTPMDKGIAAGGGLLPAQLTGYTS